MSDPPGLAVRPPADLWETMRTARTIRRFADRPLDNEVLARCLEAATWAPSGSNEQPWRFVVLRSDASRAIIGPAYRRGWESTAAVYGIERPAPGDDSRRARMTRSMFHLVEHAHEVPAFVAFCVRLTPGFPELLGGSSIYPALENFLLACRGEGLGTAVSSWFSEAEAELREHIGMPPEWRFAALVAVGYPQGRHGPVRRRAVETVTALDHWDAPLLEHPLGRVPEIARMPPLEERSLTAVLQRCGDVDRDRVALSDAGSGTTLTRGELHWRVRRTAGFFASIGVEEPVAVMLDDHLDHALAILGLCAAGGVQVPVNTAFRGDLLRNVLTVSGASTMIVEARYVARVVEIAADVPQLRRLVVRGDATGAPPDVEVLDLGRLHDAAPVDIVERLPSDLYGIMFTSGTSGASKAVPTTHGHAYAYASPDAMRATERDDVSLIVLPLFHISGQLWGVFNALMTGAHAVIAGGFSASQFWAQVDRWQATFTTLPGAAASFLHQAPPAADDAAHTLRRLNIAPIPSDVEEFCSRFGIESHCTGYGSTEAGSALTSPVPRSAGSIGWVRPEWEAQVVDAHDVPVAPGTVGELVLRAREPWVMMDHYLGDPAATVRAWRNGWFHTGDAVRRQVDGEHFLVGRLGDVIRRRGENISAAEVEAVLARHPSVGAVAVIGVVSEHSEQDVMAVVQASAEAVVDPAALFHEAKRRLPYFMVPRFVRVVEALPLTATGKVRKQALRDEGVTAATWDAQAHGLSATRHDD